ncbi:MAG: hypothetical protein VR72_00740 [Clostridiaceae bacterium BRH_c20a]|nr:MAG: hypothetical protein VR72_00740 [Clostridiaceae bacterium BRH_c20a]
MDYHGHLLIKDYKKNKMVDTLEIFSYLPGEIKAIEYFRYFLKYLKDRNLSITYLKIDCNRYYLQEGIVNLK